MFSRYSEKKKQLRRKRRKRISRKNKVKENTASTGEIKVVELLMDNLIEVFENNRHDKKTERENETKRNDTKREI
jgi:hypothetical protein